MSLPVQFACWMHMHHFLSVVCLSRLDQKITRKKSYLKKYRALEFEPATCSTTGPCVR